MEVSELYFHSISLIRNHRICFDASYLPVSDSVTPAIDIYSFGMCALEMAALEIQGNGDSGTIVTEENVKKTIESLDDFQQKDFIRKCLQVDPLSRPSARELLFHPVLFEVHSLKLLAAHALVNSASKCNNIFRYLIIILRYVKERITCYMYMFHIFCVTKVEITTAIVIKVKVIHRN